MNRKLAPSALLFIAFSYSILSNAAAENRSTDQPESRPNIVLIIADNQSSSLLGAYGNQEIETPNIDELAKRGIIFTNAFAASGVCSPTRAAILTGLIPSQTGVHNALPSSPDAISVENWSSIEEFRTLPQTLSSAGYHTAMIGKFHLGSHENAQLGFNHWVAMDTGHTKSFVDTDVVDNGKHVGVTRHATDYWTDKAIEYLSTRRSDQPFFLMLSYNGPYMLPPVVTGLSHSKHAPQYEANTPSFPQEPVHEFLRGWAIGQPPSEGMQADATHAWAAISALNNRRAMINTAAETTTVDAGVGRVMASLEDNDLRKNTVVIYTSDQGSAYGQHGLWGNTSWAFPFPAYDIHMRIPLIFSHPEGTIQSKSSALLVNQIDLFPTILDYVGLGNIEIEGTTGRSVMPTLNGSSDQDERPVFFEFITSRVVRTSEWKFIKRFPAGPNELYQVATDPGEQNNLNDDDQFSAVRNRLESQLDNFFLDVANPEYDLWNGGTAKGRLIEDYGQNQLFEDRFPSWRPPFIEKATPFSGYP